ncbi:MAG: hypothetical protein HKM93_20155 [Desulfobacteraceae bacterium]|nr:hypothetical protein [Desulfobacteraceae bacterium]
MKTKGLMPIGFMVSALIMVFLFNACKQNSDVKENPMTMQTNVVAERPEVPAIDVNLPSEVETASFGLG